MTLTKLWLILYSLFFRQPLLKFGLLIGANYAKILEPQELIPSKNGGPFEFRSPLCRFFVGPLIKINKSGKISCNRIVAQGKSQGAVLLIILKFQMR